MTDRGARMTTGTESVSTTNTVTSVGDVVLSISGITKRFGATPALRGVSFDLRKGEILGLVGANGAGKTTLTRILVGECAPTSGTVQVHGQSVSFSHVGEASAAGLRSIPQSIDSALVPELSIARNLTLPDLASGALGRFPTARSIRRAAERIAGGRLDVDLRVPVREVDASHRQQLLIARALSTHPAVLVLDEPTATLSVVEQARLHEDVRALAAGGTALIYITHHLDEVAELCDSVIVLRDGLVTARVEQPFAPADLVAPMLGDLSASLTRRGRAERSRRRDPGSDGGESATPVLELRGIRPWPGAEPSDITVHKGEVVGITGLVGAGKTELLHQIVGIRSLVSGEIRWNGRAFSPRSPRDAIRAGIGYVPEDRFRQGEIPGWSVAATITLPDLRRYRGRGGLIDRRRENAAARSVMDALHVVASGPRAPIDSLSGGNRQKVVVGRWVAAGSQMLIFDEPFRGVDIGARADIAAMLRTSACALVTSSDPEEILEVADRVLIVSNGCVVAEVDPRDVDAERLTHLITATGKQE